LEEKIKEKINPDFKDKVTLQMKGIFLSGISFLVM